MKSKLRLMLVAAAVGALCAFTAPAAELTYNPLQPQTGDAENVIQHKAAVATVQTAKALAGGSANNITATGTTTITGVTALDRLVINKAGGADTAIVLKSGTTTFATASGAAQAALAYGVAIASGTLTIVVTGTAPDVTAVYH